jgi:hypothetical protein
VTTHPLEQAQTVSHAEIDHAGTVDVEYPVGAMALTKYQLVMNLKKAKALGSLRRRPCSPAPMR